MYEWKVIYLYLVIKIILEWCVLLYYMHKDFLCTLLYILKYYWPVPGASDVDPKDSQKQRLI